MTERATRSTRITDVAVSGFKGAEWAYPLSPGTVLSGPNGSGKSTAIEALRYVLTGQVPAGKALDAVARYFPPTGGFAKVFRADKATAKRGITIDHDKAKVSEVEETSEGSTWRADPVVLDLKEFLSLSPAKRREYVLELCGSSDTPDTARILAEIDLEYARMVGGPAATHGIYLQLDQLPPDLATRLQAYQAPRGPREVLASYFAAGQTLASLCLLLRDQAKQERLGHGRAGREAHQAVKKLAESAKGVEAAAALLADARASHEAAFAALNAGRQQNAKRREAEAAKDAATRRREAAVNQLEALKEEVKKSSGDLGPEPKVPDPIDVAADLQLATQLQNEAASLRGHDEREKLRDIVRNMTMSIELAQRELGAIQGSATGLTLLTIEGIPDRVHEDMPRLRRLVTTICQKAVERMGTLEADLKRYRETLAAATPNLERAEAKAAKTEQQIVDLEGRSNALRRRAQATTEAQNEAIRQARQALAAWSARKALADGAASRISEAEARAQEAWDAEDAAVSHWIAVVEAPLFELEAAERHAREKVDVASEATAQLKAYREAEAKAEREKLLEEVWKAVEAALATVQEKVVGSAALPLVAALNEFLAAAGRHERAYLDLENDRGKPIFDIGWIDGDARVPIQAMSGGEAVLFGAGLSLAIALRSEGLRILLVEADPLDAGNLHQLLNGLTPSLADLDACLIATARELGEVHGEEWSLITSLPGRRAEAALPV